MKKLFFIAVIAVAVFGVSCEETIFPNTIKDEPFVEFFEESMTVGAEGGEVIIPVTSTGVDNVEIIFDYYDQWETDTENGDLTPKEGWIKLVKVINYYEVPTRDLIKWDSGICIYVEPNTTGYERKAKISVRSFMLHDTIEIVQSAGDVAE